jgi:hypothetical protein
MTREGSNTTDLRTSGAAKKAELAFAIELRRRVGALIACEDPRLAHVLFSDVISDWSAAVEKAALKTELRHAMQDDRR